MACSVFICVLRSFYSSLNVIPLPSLFLTKNDNFNDTLKNFCYITILTSLSYSSLSFNKSENKAML